VPIPVARSLPATLGWSGPALRPISTYTSVHGTSMVTNIEALAIASVRAGNQDVQQEQKCIVVKILMSRGKCGSWASSATSGTLHTWLRPQNSRHQMISYPYDLLIEDPSRDKVLLVERQVRTYMISRLDQPKCSPRRYHQRRAASCRGPCIRQRATLPITPYEDEIHPLSSLKPI